VFVAAAVSFLSTVPLAGATELYLPHGLMLLPRLTAACRIGPPPAVTVGWPDVVFIIRNTGRDRR
jgi:hypothetical protein